MKSKGYRILLILCAAAVAAFVLAAVPSWAKTVAGTTSRNTSHYDFNCVYTLTNDTANKRYSLEVTAQLKINKYRFSTEKEHKVNIKINGTTYTKTFSGLSGGDNATVVTKNLYTKTVNFSYASEARSVPVSITTTDIESGGYGPGICKASATVTIPAVSTTKTISGSVIWQDNNNQDGLRSARAVTVKRDGTAYKTVSTSESWSMAVPVYKSGGGTSVYTVSGNALSGYSGPVVSGYNLTYTRSVFYTTSVTGTITWNDMENRYGSRPQQIQVCLMKENVLEKQITVMPDQEGNWTFQFTELPKFYQGQEIQYSVKQEVSGYETEYQKMDILNTWIPVFDVRAGFCI